MFRAKPSGIGPIVAFGAGSSREFGSNGNPATPTNRVYLVYVYVPAPMICGFVGYASNGVGATGIVGVYQDGPDTLTLLAQSASFAIPNRVVNVGLQQALSSPVRLAAGSYWAAAVQGVGVGFSGTGDGIGSPTLGYTTMYYQNTSIALPASIPIASCVLPTVNASLSALALVAA